MTTRYSKSSAKGMTLIEVLIGIVIMSLLGLGLLSLQYILSQNQLLVFDTYQYIEESNSNVSAFIKEIRNARQADNASYVLVSAGDFEIIFYSDYDFDSNVERVRYTLTGTTLTKGIIEPSGYPVSYPQAQETIKTLTTNVRNAEIPLFYYYNEDWPQDTLNNPLVSNLRLSQTKTVGIKLILNPNPDEPTKNYTIESFGQIRSLKENL